MNDYSHEEMEKRIQELNDASAKKSHNNKSANNLSLSDNNISDFGGAGSGRRDKSQEKSPAPEAPQNKQDSARKE
eukprot:CAMPEP_0114578688 /NCGR_PEP_ID=MMETSP0125-20121206/3196_1 /TAXON_ID=485358 ORGANISM="Aristerostoma sp., Strain ATCC 50986" /NCGR_SAMPLE_ID=MMETSP0125 /ASSEMBLY_ACC=CAM_ASM_000245 /LENGTH=74 /DNA_ID=CAMNT_0001768945 /DNA_START=148 /DNA_END=372 /DNA_ORIENTATION=+